MYVFTPSTTNGSSSAPALTFNNDTNTGIYQNVRDQIVFVSNGTQIASIDSNLNIGTGYTGGQWDTPHLTMGLIHIWYDNINNTIRFKLGAPTCYDDGVAT